MRVALDAKRAFNNNTGLGNYSRTIINALAQQKNIEKLFLMNSNKNSKLYLHPKNTELIEPAFSSKITSSYWRKNKMGQKAIDLKADVFHGLSAELPKFSPSNKIKKVVTIHDLIFLSNPEYYKSFDRKIYTRKTFNALEKADTIIAISQFTADLIKDKWGDSKPIKVIHPIIEDSGLILKKTNSGKAYFVFISSFQKRKNHLSLINTFAQWSLNKEVNLVLAGRPGETLKDCKTLIKKLNLEDNILIKTDINASEKQNLLYFAKGFIYPSEIEGFGIPLVEALYQQTPILCPDLPLYKEVAGQYAQYYSNQQEMLIGFDNLINQESKWQGLESYLTKFSGKFVGKELIEVYESIL